MLSTKYAFDARMIRGTGNPFHRAADASIVNNFRLRLTNRTDDPRQYRFDVIAPDGAVIRAAAKTPIQLDASGTQLIPVTIQVPASQFSSLGQCESEIKITDDIGNERTVTMKLLGPRR